MNEMLTEKEISKLRRISGHKWISWFVLVMAACSVFSAGKNLISIQRLHSLSGLTWQELLATTFSSPGPAPFLRGWESIAAMKMHGAMLSFGLAIAFIACYFIIKRLHGKDALLDEQVCEAQETQQVSGAHRLDAESTE